MSSDNQIPAHHQMVLVSRSTLDSLTEGIAASLSRMKDLEDQVKVIPSLQRTVDMMLQSSCSSNGFCTTNSQRSTPSTTSLESNNQLINTRSNNKTANDASNYNCSPTDRVASPMNTKMDFDDLINDLISLSYSVNYISSSSNSSNTLASSVNNMEPCKEPSASQHRSFHRPNIINNHSLPSAVKHDRFVNISHKIYNNNNNNNNSLNKPATSLHSVETDQDDDAKNHYSCPTFFSTLTHSNHSTPKLNVHKPSTKKSKDVAINTDLFMEDIITRSELNSYIRKQQQNLYKDTRTAAGGCQLVDASKQRSTAKQQGKVATHDIAVDCNIGTPTFKEPTSSTATTTSSNFTGSTHKQHSDTGYDTFERCEVATQVDKNLWGIMNYLSQDNTIARPQLDDIAPNTGSTSTTTTAPNEHVTTIMINQTQTEELPTVVKMHQNRAAVDRHDKTIEGPRISNRGTNYKTNDSDSREKVQIKVELPTSGQFVYRSGKTSIPISISSLSSSSASNPTNSRLSISGQLFSELTTSSEEDEKESDDSSNDSTHDRSELSSSSDDEISLSEEEEDGDDDQGDVASSLGSYQDPSDFEEYCAFGLTAPFGKIRDQSSKVPLVTDSINITNLVPVNSLRQPSKDFKEALKYLADHLREDDDLNKIQEVTSYFEVIRKEWFGVATRKDSCYQLARVYLNLFESHSKQLLNTVVNLTDIAGNSVLHYAASHFNYNLLNVLLDTKICDMNRRNRAGYTPIMLLALADIGDQFKEMVARRVFQLGNVNIKATQNGQTALMLAVSHGRTKTCRILLECGADPSLQDNDGSTALMCGSEIGHLEIVKCLLAHKLTDPNATDNDGLDALAIAMENGHRDVGLVLYAAKNMLRTTGGSSGVGASLRRTSSKSSSLYPLRRSDSLASSKNRPPTRTRL